jgi:oligoribonuclease
MSINGDALIWIDLEMDGLDLTKNYILEIACIVTDFDLTITHEGYFPFLFIFSIASRFPRS